MTPHEIARFARALRAPDATLDSLLDETDRAARRLDVHRNNVATALGDALRAAFPVVRRLLGDEYFDAMAAVYARTYPPRSRVLLRYGDELPDFLAHFEPLAAWPYLADVARLERLRVRAFHARDELPYSVASVQRAIELADVAGALRLSSSAALLDSAHAVGEIWLSQVEERALPAALRRPQSALVWRHDFAVRLEIADEPTRSFVHAIGGGASPRSALDALGASAVQFQFTLARLLREGALVPDPRLHSIPTEMNR